MQKDKAAGDPIGASICATHASACLSKLRAKMQLLQDHCHSATACMKRRPAVVAGPGETRSLLQLRMGFLSIQYGILLRWNPQSKITLVVLRKNCPASFLYLPDAPVPSARAVQVTVRGAGGLPGAARWTAQLQLGDAQESVVLVREGHEWLPKLQREVVGTARELVIRLYQHERRARVLRSTMRVPTESVQEEPTMMRIPCPEGGFLQLEAVMYAKRARPKPVLETPVLEKPMEESPVWDWLLCSVC